MSYKTGQQNRGWGKNLLGGPFFDNSRKNTEALSKFCFGRQRPPIPTLCFVFFPLSSPVANLIFSQILHKSVLQPLEQHVLIFCWKACCLFHMDRLSFFTLRQLLRGSPGCDDVWTSSLKLTIEPKGMSLYKQVWKWIGEMVGLRNIVCSEMRVHSERSCVSVRLPGRNRRHCLWASASSSKLSDTQIFTLTDKISFLRHPVEWCCQEGEIVSEDREGGEESEG